MGEVGEKLLCGTQGAMFEFVTARMISPKGPGEHTGILFMDPGANLNFVVEDVALSMGLKGTSTTLQIKVVNREYQEKEAKIYQLGLEDRFGNVHWVEAVGVQSITDSHPVPNTQEEATAAFPDIPAEALQRPVGRAVFLVSMTERHLHATGGEAVGKLRLDNTPFGCGVVLTGLGEQEAQQGPILSAECCSLQAACAVQTVAGKAFHLQGPGTPLLDVHEAQELGCNPPPMCYFCLGCRVCSCLRSMPREERETLRRVEDNMTLDKASKKLTASYLWRNSADKMISNQGQAIAVQEKIEARAVASGTHTEFVKAVEEMISFGTLREITVEQQSTYQGPVHYVTLLKEASVSTKVRIVSNAAMPNFKTGRYLNDVMKKGPDLMVGLMKVLLHWRTVETMVLFDLTKAYWQIHTREKELHLRRTMWRSDPREP